MRGVGQTSNRAYICTLITLVNAGAVNKGRNGIGSREAVWIFKEKSLF